MGYLEVFGGYLEVFRMCLCVFSQGFRMTTTHLDRKGGGFSLDGILGGAEGSRRGGSPQVLTRRGRRAALWSGRRPSCCWSGW